MVFTKKTHKLCLWNIVTEYSFSAELYKTHEILTLYVNCTSLNLFKTSKSFCQYKNIFHVQIYLYSASYCYYDWDFTYHQYLLSHGEISREGLLLLLFPYLVDVSKSYGTKFVFALNHYIQSLSSRSLIINMTINLLLIYEILNLFFFNAKNPNNFKI